MSKTGDREFPIQHVWLHISPFFLIHLDKKKKAQGYDWHKELGHGRQRKSVCIWVSNKVNEKNIWL